MKVLIMSSIYPTPEKPAVGTFVRTRVESLKRAGVDIELLLLDGRFRKWNYLKAPFQLRRRLAMSSIDLVHAHYGYVGMVARTQWRVPLVVTYHGGDLMGLVNERGEKTFSSPLIVASGKVLARCVDASIVQTAEMARLLEGLPNVFTIPHGVDFDVFRPIEKERARAALGLQPAKKYLLFAMSTRNPFKRFPFAKAVTGHLAAHVPSIELLVVSEETQERLALYMSACDLLVFPSYQEGSPNVVKQAMACNLPIVSTDVGDVRELIGKTEGCYICEPNVPEFSTRIAAILASGRRTNGRDQIRHLESSVVAQQVIGVYEYALQNRGKRALARTEARLLATRK